MIAQPQLATAPPANGVARPWSDEVFVLPATVGQQSFWYLDQLRPGNPAYNIAVRFRLQGPLREEVLERALNEVVRRHEVLRTTFAVVDGLPVQVVAPRLAVPLPQIDLRGVPETDRGERARDAAAEEARLPFDLAKGPLIRAKLLRLGDEEHTLLVTVHHTVSDGWSIGLLTQELGALYDAYYRGLASPLPELALQYGDFAVWQEQWLRTTDLAGQLAYWSRQLTDLPTTEIPPDRPRPPVQTFPGMIDSVLLPRGLTDGLVALSQRENATLFVVMLAAFQLLLRRYSGRDDVVAGTVLAGRSRVELEPLIGLFINPVVLRGDLSGDPRFLDLLPRVRDMVVQAFANQDVPFERVVDAVRRRRDRGRHPLFQINLLFQRDFVQSFRAAGLTLTAIPSVSPGSIYDLNFFLVERAEGWRASCEYNTDLYDAATVRRLLGEFQTILEGVAADPARRLSEIPLTAAVEQEPPAPPPTAPGPPPKGAAPRDSVEARMKAVWERVLGVGELSTTADFFEAGGHSLLAARLLVEVEKAFGQKLPLVCLLQYPTVETFTARLRAEQAPAPPEPAAPEGKWQGPAEQVFPMRREGTRPPLFLVDAGPFHRPLVRRLGGDQPVFGIALPELAALPERFTVQDIAANLVEALCASGMDGPYHLAGWSQAGVIAYEVARQLRKRGKEVALVILLDASNPTYLRRFRGWKNFPIRLYLRVEKVLYHLRKMRGMPFWDAWRYFKKRTRKFQLNSPAKARRWDDSSETPPPTTWQVQYMAAAGYVPEPCPSPVVLFRSEVLQTGWFRDPQLGWGGLAHGGLRMYEMAGEHDAMFLEPGVQRLAALLRECLGGGKTADAPHPPKAALAR